jgi:outer membrane receptor for ferrienterochelin and colicins
VAGLVTLLSPQHGTNVTGTTQSNLGFLNLTTLQVDRTAADVVDISPLRQTITETYEIGYKGLIGERVVFAVDAYHARRRNHIGPLRVETPFVLAPAVAAVIGDLQGAIADGIAGNAQLMAQLNALGLPPQAVAGLLTQLAAADLQASLPAAGTPIGIVQPQENAVPGQLLLSYRNYQQVDYCGVDVSTQFMASDRLNFFGNASWLSDNFFVVEPLGTRGAELELSMNAPKIKVRGGFDYAVPRGWRLNAALRHVGSFDVRSGPYSGTVEAFTLLDLGAGYDLDAYVPGMRIDVSVLNVLDNVHRQFIGAPQMGRLALARIIYTI